MTGDGVEATLERPARLTDLDGVLGQDAYDRGLEQGRADAAVMWPMVWDEGFKEGHAAARHRLAWRLRERCRHDLAARTLLLDVLDGLD